MVGCNGRLDVVMLRFFSRYFLGCLLLVATSACVTVIPRDESLSSMLRDWKIRAERGEGEAQYNLGWYHSQSSTSVGDDEVALEWFEKSAKQGVKEAQFALATFLERGRGVVSPRPEQAHYWYRQAAEGGLARAQYNLGASYARSLEVSGNAERAYRWIFLAAVQDYLPARRALRLLSKRMSASARVIAHKSVRDFLRNFSKLQEEREKRVYAPPPESGVSDEPVRDMEEKDS